MASSSELSNNKPLTSQAAVPTVQLNLQSLASANGKGKQQLFGKTQKVTAKWHLDRNNTIEMAQSSHECLRDAFLWVVMGEGESRIQMTIHRPIGTTNCPKNSWVMSPSDSVPHLIAGSRENSESAINQKRVLYKTRWLVKHKLFDLIDNNLCYPIDVDKNQPQRGDILDAAAKEYAEFKREFRSNVRAEHPKWDDDKVNRQPISKSQKDFLLESYRTHEDLVNKKLKENFVQEQAEHAFPSVGLTTYLGGQEQIPFFVAESAHKVKDFLFSLMTTTGKTETENKGSSLDFGPIEKEIQDLKQEVEEFQKTKVRSAPWASITVSASTGVDPPTSPKAAPKKEADKGGKKT